MLCHGTRMQSSSIRKDSALSINTLKLALAPYMLLIWEEAVKANTSLLDLGIGLDRIAIQDILLK